MGDWQREVIRGGEDQRDWVKETLNSMQRTLDEQGNAIKKSEAFLRFFWWYLLAAMALGAAFDHLAFYR